MLKVSESSLADCSIEETLTKFWSLESMGIHPNDENSVHESFLANIKFDGTRYEVKLPFKEVHPVLPDNFRNSIARLGSLLRRLKQDPEVLQEYNAFFMEQSSKSMIEDVTDNMLPAGGVHYIPHHAVIRRDKETTKLRIVFDALSKTEGVSLNECLNSGPCLVPNLFDVLLRFRCHQIALISDIEKAFLQVSIAPEHRDFLRFLWVSDVNEAHPKIVIKRMTRAMFGVTSSPFLLGGTLQHHISKYEEEDPEIVKKLLESFYVDDFNSGEENVDQAFELYIKSKKILSDGGFTLRKWSSDSNDLSELIRKYEPDATTITNTEESQEESSYAEIMLGHPNQDTQAEGEQKVLGLLWNTKEDTLVFRFGYLINLAKELLPTKRSLIKVIASVYDPIGFISQFIIPMKILFHDLCSEKEDWDSPLSAEHLKRWKNWITELSKVQEVFECQDFA